MFHSHTGIAGNIIVLYTFILKYTERSGEDKICCIVFIKNLRKKLGHAISVYEACPKYSYYNDIK